MSLGLPGLSRRHERRGFGGLVVGLVAGLAESAVQFGVMGERDVLEQRDVQLGVAFDHVGGAAIIEAVAQGIVVVEGLVLQVVGDVAVLTPPFGARAQLDRPGAEAAEQVAVDVPGDDLLGVGRIFLQGPEGVVDGRRAGVAGPEQVDRHAARRVGIAQHGLAADDVAAGIAHRVQSIGQIAADHVVEEVLVVLVLAVFAIGVPAPAAGDVALEAAGDPPGRVVGLVAGRDLVQHAAAELRAEGSDVSRLSRSQIGIVRRNVETDEDVGRLGDLQGVGADGPVRHRVHGLAAGEPAFEEAAQVIGEVIVDVGQAGVAAH